jgi:dolichyl-phosphate-mannose-protein mannosyltransferase
MNREFRKAATSLVLIFAVALGSRLAFAWDQERKIPPGVLGIAPFQQETGNIAYSLAVGHGFGSVFRGNTGPTAWLTPVYPLLVAAMFKLFGTFTVQAFFAVVFLNILFSAAACAPIFYVGKRIAGLGVASGAAWLWALFPNAVMIPFEWIWDTSLSALLAPTILWATLELAESPRLSGWCGYGLLWGLTLMTNPALVSLLPLLLGWAVYRSCGKGLSRLSRPALAFGVVVLCCLPWTIRNYVVFHRSIPLRSNLPFELWLGNNDIYDDHSPNTRTRITRYEEVRRYTQLGETAFLQEKWEKATQFIRSHPGLELHLIGKRVVATWTGLESPVRDFLATDSLLIRGVLLCNVFAAAGALLGTVALWRRRTAFAFPSTAFPIVFPCLYYATHTSLRYRYPIDPIVLVLTAVAVQATLAPISRKKHAKAVVESAEASVSCEGTSPSAP